ncbi:MAG: tRNA (adenosine(37)-N6)-threonylcarbamoyltransferase complex ATPase subunit type 1 TsaE [Treponema sp.]|jgi:tRNA threonylcarbamoyladenosine biosynthesis protein TsaE|nr:tRNA (adenosine(37)-N6)-threonylcarbamoyltransferase complex ATPase subunit type 1 TsaE [Treponema sp.]
MAAADFPAEFSSDSPEETIALGERLAGFLRPGSIVALRGGLGAGKTCLTKGIARGLGVEETLTSPTYTIVSEYRGRVPLYHIDAYRLEGDEDFENLGGPELIHGEGISVIEWSERLPHSLPRNLMSVEITITGDQRRLFKISGMEQAGGNV